MTAPPTPPVTPLAVLDGFRPPAQPWLSGHRGVDLAARSGQVVRTPLAGRVTVARPVAGRWVVVVQHDGFRTTYEPVRPLLDEETPVRAGQRLGWVSEGGHCSLHCVHWGLRVGRDYRNPLLLLPPLRPILKPLTVPAPDPARRWASSGASPSTVRFTVRSRPVWSAGRPGPWSGSG